MTSLQRKRWLGRPSLIGWIALAIGLAAMPIWVNSPYLLSSLVLAGLYAIAAMGLIILMGYAGQISLGQAAFLGIGAYGSAILTTRVGWSPWVALLVMAAATTVIAMAIGILMFRLRGHYLALGTLAFGIIVGIFLTEWKSYTGGPSGLPGIPRLMLMGMPIKDDMAYYYLTWGVAMVCMLLSINIVDSRFGRALRAIRDNEDAAASLGINVTRHKLIAFGLSAFFASVAGSLYAHYMIFISPGAFDYQASVHLLLMAALGGLGSVWGAPLGAIVVMLLTLGLRELIPLLSPQGSGEQQIVAYGILLVVIMIFLPGGLSKAIAQGWQRLSRGPFGAKCRAAWSAISRSDS